MDPLAAIPRVVFIGASNMTRGFAVLRELARRTWGEPVSVLAAIGHGRAYGLPSSLFGRALPSVLDCGLWRALEAGGPAPTTAVVGDVGNDFVYGAPVDAVLGSVEECLRRLRAGGARTVLTSLPPPVLGISRLRFEVFRKLFFPARHLTYPALGASLTALEQGLRALAAAHGAAHVELRPEWYGLDPIHIRPLRCRDAWRHVLRAAAEAPDCPRVGFVRAMETYRLFPERQWLFGREMRRAQPCVRLATGSTVALY
jgi:hypothetical protein